jgi:RimJ/RimL family protein N-acetyltransferase
MSERFENPVYRIETERLVLRCYNPPDAQMIADSVSESLEHLKPWMPWAHNEPEPVELKVERLKRFRAEFDVRSLITDYRSPITNY